MAIGLLTAPPLTGAHAVLRMEPLWKEALEGQRFRVDAQRVHADRFGDPIAFECPVGGDCRVELSEGTWIFSSGDPRFHVFPRSETLLPAPAPAPVVALRVARTARVEGELVVPRTVERLSLHFREDGERPLEGSVDCAVENARWSCTAPAGQWDLKIAIPAHVAEYRWDVTIDPEKRNELGRLSFQAGASLVGRIEVENGVARTDLAGSRVVLLPDAPVRTREERQQTTRSVKPNRRGFFQFGALAPGEYILTVSGRGLVAETQRITIVAGREAQLRAPLRIGRPRKVAVLLMPPLDSFGERWRVALEKELLEQRTISKIGESVAAVDGSWSFDRAWPGKHFLRVRDAAGSEWIWRPIDVDDDVNLAVAIDSTTVRGELRLGKTPIPANLKFSGESGAEIKMTANDEGLFSGRIPARRDEKWNVDVESPDHGIHRTVRDVSLEFGPEGDARVTLTLPDGRFGGTVVSDDGSTPTRALVKAVSRDVPDSLMSLDASEAGQFSFSGLPAGRYGVSAERGSKSGLQFSDTVEITVDEDGDGSEDLVLKLRAPHGVRGVVTSRDAPVVGARLICTPGDRDFLYLLPATTDLSGRFELYLPPGTTSGGFFVEAPGFATRLFHHAIEPGPMTIRLTQTGGELQLRVPPWNEDDPRGLHPWILHEGAIIHARAFMRAIEWGEKEVVITAGQVDPGAYTLCLGRSDQWPLMLARMFPGPCQSGMVAPFGQLSLRAAIPADK